MILGNLELAERLEEVGRLLEIQGAERYLVRTYRRAARSVLGASHDVMADLLAGGDPCKLSGFGPYLSRQLRSFAFQGAMLTGSGSSRIWNWELPKPGAAGWDPRRSSIVNPRVSSYAPWRAPESPRGPQGVPGDGMGPPEAAQAFGGRIHISGDAAFSKGSFRGTQNTGRS